MDSRLVESFVASWERIVAEAVGSRKDGLVYGLYRLTEEEILVVEGGKTN